MEPRIAPSGPYEASVEPGPELGLERAQLETLLTHIPVGLVVVDAGSRRIARMNPEAERLLDASAEQANDPRRYRGFASDGHEYEPDEWPAARTLATGETVRNESIRLRFADGTERTISVTSAPVRAGTRITAALLVLDDVTERELRAQAERDFVTNAAHELQTPIAAITSAIEVLQAGAKDSSERDVFLDHIDRAADRLGRLTRALLVLARAQTGAELPRNELLPVAPLLQGLAARSGAEVAVRCPDELAVIANRFLLEQTLGNLIENAVDHGRTDVRVLARLDGDRALIEVRDSGPGIRDEIAGQVLSRFFRAGPTGGFGLGLAIANESVTAMGGRLTLEPSARGTCVSVTLPGARLQDS